MVQPGLREVAAMGFSCQQVFEGDRANPECIAWLGSRPIACRYIPKFHPAAYLLRGKIDSLPLGLGPFGFGIPFNHIGGSDFNKLTFICSKAWL